MSLTGVARIVKDRALIDRLWTEAWKVWFPKGKDDPSIGLLEVDVSVAEYWDQSGAKGIRYLFEAVAAYVRGTRPAVADDEQNAKVEAVTSGLGRGGGSRPARPDRRGRPPPWLTTRSRSCAISAALA